MAHHLFRPEGMYNYKLLAAAGLVASAWLPNLIAALLKVRIPNVVVIVYYFSSLQSCSGSSSALPDHLLVRRFHALPSRGAISPARDLHRDAARQRRFSEVLTAFDLRVVFRGLLRRHLGNRRIRPCSHRHAGRSYSPARSEVVIDLIMNALGAFMVVILLTLDARAYGHKYLERLLRKFTHEGPPDRTNEKSF